MRCAGCGQTLGEAVEVCAHCGTARPTPLVSTDRPGRAVSPLLAVVALGVVVALLILNLWLAQVSVPKIAGALGGVAIQRPPAASASTFAAPAPPSAAPAEAPRSIEVARLVAIGPEG
ncbi:MAG TPA: hypothetical protein VIN09_06380, partial [Chloroflexota bacterium]